MARWLWKRWLRREIGDYPGNHVGRLNRLMRDLREICSDEFPEDNQANTYWHLRQALDDVFPSYHGK